MEPTTSSRTNGAASLEERLNNPDTAAALNRLLDRLDTVEETVDKLEAIMEQAPAMAAMATDIADDAYRSAEAAGVDLDERLQQALQLAERLTAPRTVAVLTRLTERIDELEQLIALADQAPGFIAMTVDMFDDVYRTAEQAGHDPEHMIRRSLAALPTVMASGLLDPEAIETIGKMGDALASARAHQQRDASEVGLFGLLRAMRDPDVRRALGFLTTFGKQFGQALPK